MIEIYNTIYDMISSGDYSLLWKCISLCMSISIFIAALRLILWSLRSIGSGGSGYEDDSESDNSGKKVDLTKKNNMFTKYYDHYDQD